MFQTNMVHKGRHYVEVSQSPQVGAMFQTDIESALNENGGKSQSPQVGAMFQTDNVRFFPEGKNAVSIPSSRGDVSDS